MSALKLTKSAPSRDPLQGSVSIDSAVAGGDFDKHALETSLGPQITDDSKGMDSQPPCPLPTRGAVKASDVSALPWLFCRHSTADSMTIIY